METKWKQTVARWLRDMSEHGPRLITDEEISKVNAHVERHHASSGDPDWIHYYGMSLYLAWNIGWQIITDQIVCIVYTGVEVIVGSTALETNDHVLSIEP